MGYFRKTDKEHYEIGLTNKNIIQYSGTEYSAAGAWLLGRENRSWKGKEEGGGGGGVLREDVMMYENRKRRKKQERRGGDGGQKGWHQHGRNEA